MQSLAEDGAFDGVGAANLKFRAMVLPDRFLDHDKPEKLYAGAGLDAKGIVAKVLATLGRSRDARKSMIA
jgi:1-deoxy-D-xylulose-5-phosphate synthase